MRHKIAAFAQAIKVFSFLAVLSTPAIGSVPKDTLNAYQMKLIGDSLSARGRFTESSEYYTKALEDYDALSYHMKGLKIKRLIGDNLWRLGQYDQAKNLFLEIIQNANHIAKKKNDLLADTYTSLGVVYAIQGLYDSALHYSKKSIKINEALTGLNNESVATTINNISLIYWNMGYYDSTKYYLNKTLDIQMKIFPENDFRLSRTYNNLGAVHTSLGLPLKGIEYLNRAITLILNKYDENYYTLAGIYLSIGGAYDDMQMYDAAIENYEKALQVCHQQSKVDDHMVTKILNNLGNTNIDIKKFREAKKYLNQSLEIKQKVLGHNHPEVGIVYQGLGTLHSKSENYDSAIYFYQEALSLLVNETDFKIDVVLSLGHVFELQHRFELSREQFKKGIVLNTYQNEDVNSYLDSKFDAYIDRINLLNSISDLARIYHKEYILDQEATSENPTDSRRLFQICDDLIQEIRKDYLSTQERIEFSKNSHDVYRNATENSIALYKETQDESFAQKAFYFSEKSRANSLLMASLEHSSLSFSDIPDTLRGKENNLKIDISKLEEQLTNERLKGSDSDSSKINDLSVKYFNSKREYESLIQTFASSHPKYYQLKYQTEKIPLGKIQKKLISDDQIILEYMVTDSTIHVFLISSENLRIVSIEKDSLFTEKLESFKAELRNPKTYDNMQNRFLAYVENSYSLYQCLLDPVADMIQNKDLIIVADEQLSDLPFEAMIRSKETGESYSFSNLDYVIRHHSIVYAHSVEHLYYEFVRVKSEKTPSKNEILAFAPSFTNLESVASPDEILRYDLVPLKGTTDEIQKISEYFNTETYSGFTATEKEFKEKAADFNIIHIASHALINEKQPMQNKIAFVHSKEDSLNDGFLHVFELYNTQLNADMVVLSACNTGYGKSTQGEGPLSLAKSFLYAGCKSVVMSLWFVNDKSTNELMGNFYKHLSEGKTKGIALQQAKLDYLLASHELSSHPYYWAPFVISGDASPIETRGSYQITFGMIGVIALLMVVFFYLRVKRIRSQNTSPIA